MKYIANADVLIIGGTSLTVYPAAGLIDYYRGHKLVLINKSVTPMDNRADLVISGPIGRFSGTQSEYKQILFRMIDESRRQCNVEYQYIGGMGAHIKRAAKAQKTGGRNYVSGSRESL